MKSTERAHNSEQTFRPMEIHSIRLPGNLWDELNEICKMVNRTRRKPLSVSTIIRELIEIGLRESSEVLFQPRKDPTEYNRHDTAEKSSPGSDIAAHAFEVFQQFGDFAEKSGITPRIFFEAVGGDRSETYEFFFTGRLPAQNGPIFLERVERWLKARKINEG